MPRDFAEKCAGHHRSDANRCIFTTVPGPVIFAVLRSFQAWRRGLFTDAEFAENLAEEIVAGECAGDLAERLVRQAQFFCEQLACS